MHTATLDAPASSPLRRLLPFMLIACGFSWAFWLPVIASTHGLIPVRIPATPWGSFGPMVAWMVMSWRRGGLREALKTLVHYRGDGRWLLVAAGIPLAATAVALIAHVALVGPLPGFDAGKLVWAPAIVLLILVLGGPVGEEPGWRGFVTPLLLERYSVAATSLIVSVVWLVWHLPLFWMEGAAQQGESIPAFAAMVLAYSVVFSWLYTKTSPSLVPAILLHTAVNVPAFSLPLLMRGVDESRPYQIGYLAAVVVIAFVCLAVPARSRS